MAMAALDAPQREALIKKVDQIRMNRQASPADIAKFSSKTDPGYLALKKRLDEKFQDDLTDALIEAVPSLSSYL